MEKSSQAHSKERLVTSDQVAQLLGKGATTAFMEQYVASQEYGSSAADRPTTLQDDVRFRKDLRDAARAMAIESAPAQLEHMNYDRGVRGTRLNLQALSAMPEAVRANAVPHTTEDLQAAFYDEAMEMNEQYDDKTATDLSDV